MEVLSVRDLRKVQPMPRCCADIGLAFGAFALAVTALARSYDFFLYALPAYALAGFYAAVILFRRLLK